MSKLSEKEDIIARYRGRNIEKKLFELHVVHAQCYLVAQQESNGKELTKIINLCEDRYHFLVLFTACMLEARTTIMPVNRSEGELSRLVAADSYVDKISDMDIETICQLEMSAPGAQSAQKNFSWNINLIPDELIVAELYTSGSSGTPVGHSKTWRQLVNAAQQVYTRFSFDLIESRGERASIIATVPAQHMFGFELSIVLPLVCSVSVYYSLPFYPLDIQSALADMPAPRILVTTPTHLRACITLQQDWPVVEGVISATSPLADELACQIEDVLSTKVEEIYGCSEVGAIASRRVTTSADWELLDGYSLEIVNDAAQLSVPSVGAPVRLPDQIICLSERFFNLTGRVSDMVKMGGKRGSLADLTARLRALHGVKDAVVFRHEQSSQRQRLAALVVVEKTSTVNVEEIRAALLKNIDPVFLPRSIGLVHSLPYNATGKLPAMDLIHCLNETTQTQKIC
ncbi:MAG TPA: acyl-CoA synthetase [Gammaproteobacteria bacterium]|nr:acyl-CoA synthetase [Gammaproteobacteria bacterium]